MVDIRNFFKKMEPKKESNRAASGVSAEAASSSGPGGRAKSLQLQIPSTPSTVASDEEHQQENHSSVKSKLKKNESAKKKPPGGAQAISSKPAPAKNTAGRHKIAKGPIGTKVEKLIEGAVKYKREVTNIDHDSNGEVLYGVTYHADDDYEDCSEKALEAILLPRKKSPARMSPRAKKRRVDYKEESTTNDDDEESEGEATFDESEEEEESDFFASRRRKTSVKSNAARRAILDESSDEETDDDAKPAGKASLKPAALKTGHEDMEESETYQMPPPVKKIKPAKPSAKGNAKPAPLLKEDDKAYAVKETPTDPETPPPGKKTKTNNVVRPSSNTSAPAASAWGSLMPDRGQSSKKKPKHDDDMFLPNGEKRVVRSGHCMGDDLPVITIPQRMFDDMVSVQLTDNGRNGRVLLPILKKLHGRPLRVATMCSGTESPILALDMLSKSIEDFVYSHEDQFDSLTIKDGVPLLQIEHIFSCEIEPFKQAYIERTFHPPLLFRDIRELGRDKAHTAYGALADVPCQPGCVDLLVAGTSCVDYSNLNNEKKTIKDSGESGQTWRGLIEWIKKAKPPIVILENVCGAPWKTKVEIFERLGYLAVFILVDTKHYYIPHTRQRGYLFAVKKDCDSSDEPPIPKRVLKQWTDMVKKLERPASGTLDAFMLPNEDPRVIRGRERLCAENPNEKSHSWTKCQSRHHFARANEELGEKHPLTGAESGSTTMPPFAWNEWTTRQVQRIHDLLDIDTLRCAKEGIDCTTKSMVWDLSQNVDRDTMGKLGLSKCITPSGIPYVSSRGGPLVGEEVLLLQGIPAEDLLLTKETESNLKDLAGNAMSTTVVGACILSALLFGHFAIASDDKKVLGSGILVPSLVPRPLTLASGEIKISREFAEYSRQALPLGPLEEPDIESFRQLLVGAALSARMCGTEGLDKALPFSSLLQCKLCGFACSKAVAMPHPSKWEEHDLVEMDQPGDNRLNPSVFRSNLLSALPMRLNLHSFAIDSLEKPPAVSDKLWCGWKAALVGATQSSEALGMTSEEYRFSQLTRSHVWTVVYTSCSGSRLELQLTRDSAVWFLFALIPAKRCALRDALEKPIARMRVKPVAGNVFTSGEWEVCLPTSSSIELSIEGVGNTIPSWRASLGLKGEYESEVRFERLKISVQTSGFDEIKPKVDGEYLALPKCGGACGSLHRRQCDGANEMYFFLESGRCTLGDEDTFVFSVDKHRTSYGQIRDIILRINVDSRYRSEFQRKSTDDHQSQSLEASVIGSWVGMKAASLRPVLDEAEGKRSTLLLPVESPRVSLSPDGWKSCPSLLEAQIPVGTSDWIFTECERLLSRSKRSKVIEVNLQKSSSIFQALAFGIQRLGVPAVAQTWLELDSGDVKRKDDEEIACGVCAPIKPAVKWMMVQKGNTVQYLPFEDGQLQARYEHNVKNRPDAWLVTLEKPQQGDDITLSSKPASLNIKIGVNVVSLAHRALGLFPLSTFARLSMIDESRSSAGISDEAKAVFDWRVVSHVEKLSTAPNTEFPKLLFTSNKNTEPASQPSEFESRYPLRPEQLRSLSWMLSQEASTTPFFEEEVVEAVLPSLNWRGEGRARRPVLVRGGIVADEVGYGKTAITLGLIAAAPNVNGDPPAIPDHLKQSLLQTNATIVIVPTHLMGQWPKEISKFLGTTQVIVTIKDMSQLNKLTVNDILRADIVIVNFNFFSSDKYFPRLARFAGVDTTSLPKGNKGGRHFDDVYNQCLIGLRNRVAAHREDWSTAFDEIEKDAKHHETPAADGHVRLDGKKSVYKSVSEDQAKVSGTASMAKTKSLASAKASGVDVDPWDLRSSKVKKDIKNMKCPPLEMFFWNRVVVDEFTYLLEKADRARAQSLVLGLKSSFIWGLSATPPHETFNNIKGLASLMGVHLGIDEVLPGASSKPRGGSKEDEETSASEKFSSLMEIRSMQWHERRHRIGQKFLDRFVRQNIAEIDEIKCEEHIIVMDLPAAERGIYLEMANYLKSLEMDNKKAMRSKKSSKSDRENRTQRILENSDSAEEALLKRCAHFNIDSSTPSTALETCDHIISQRHSELRDCENELMESVAAAIRQRNLILKKDSDWKGMNRTEKGEVEDTLERYLLDVKKKNSIQGAADEEIHLRILDVLKLAEEDVMTSPLKDDGIFAAANADVEEDDDEGEGGSKSKGKRKKKDPAQVLYSMKFALRNHMHHVRGLGKELRGRMQALRYFQCVRKAQLEDTEIECVGHGSSSCECNATGGKVPRDRLGVLSSCGHVGCLSCLHHHADKGDCVDPTCHVPVTRTHIATSAGLGVDREHSAGGQYGAKLFAIVSKTKELVDGGDRVIIFAQFDDLKDKVEEALLGSGVKSLQVKGSVSAQMKTLDILQKETPGKDDPRVLLLTMDDERSSGVNLTTCNHAIFVHPLLADSQQQYDAYETQAIGRIRRYGQMKTVHIWRYLARDTIDSEIFEERRGKVPSS